jgi:gamma-glutamyltranspeptidase/glutathione hydrolase
VLLEEGIPPEVLLELGRMGHMVNTARGFERSVFGRGQIICRDASTGVRCGGSDPRADGCAMSL